MKEITIQTIWRRNISQPLPDSSTWKTRKVINILNLYLAASQVVQKSREKEETSDNVGVFAYISIHRRTETNGMSDWL